MSRKTRMPTTSIGTHLDRVPVFDQDYITALSRFLSDDTIGTNGVSLVVNGIEANGPGVSDLGDSRS